MTFAISSLHDRPLAFDIPIMLAVTFMDVAYGLLLVSSVAALAATIRRRRQESKLYRRLGVALEASGQAASQALAGVEEQSQETLRLLAVAEEKLDRRQSSQG